MKYIPTLFLSFFFTVSCEVSNTLEPTYLFEEIIKSENVRKHVEQHKKLILLNDEFCNSNDCKNLFDNPTIEIVVYNREEIFMRAIDYVQILTIDREQKILKLIYHPSRSKSQPAPETIHW